MKKHDFIMLRSLSKEEYREGYASLWKLRKNKWDYKSEKMLDAIDYCENLLDKGLVEKMEVICGLCGEAHFDRHKYKINDKGITLLTLINRKESQVEIRSEKKSILPRWINKMLKNKASSKNNNN